jgi:hypothetical protein
MSWLRLLPQAVGIYFIFKYAIASQQLKTNPKALRLMDDERELSAKQRSYSNGFIASMITLALYFFAVIILTILFENKILLELSGIFVAGYILFIGYLTVYITYMIIQKQ